MGIQRASARLPWWGVVSAMLWVWGGAACSNTQALPAGALPPEPERLGVLVRAEEVPPGDGNLRLPAPFQGMVNVWVGSGTAPQSVQGWWNAFTWMNRARKMFGDHARCVEQGFGEAGCAAQKVIWPGLCNLWGDVLVEAMGPGWGMMGLPFSAVCNGEPALKCCKYGGREDGPCHSAFNDDNPINCEGNPYGGTTYGVCIPANRYDGDPGCYCDYIPACNMGTSERTGGAAWRLNHFTVQLAKAVPDTLRASPDALLAYVTFQGCRAHFQAVTTLAPFAGADSPVPGYAVGASYQANDAQPDARYLRALTTLAVRRVLASLPNAANRWGVVGSRTWTEAQKAEYLAGTPDPDGVLLGLLGPVGFELLKKAHPSVYQLLAVPLPDEAPVPAGLKAGCWEGQPPSLALASVGVRGATVSVQASLVDPLADDNAAAGNGGYLVLVDWGDGRVEGQPYVLADPATRTWAHTYAAPGTYVVKAWVQNTSGLYAAASLSVTVTEGSASGAAPSIESIELELEAVVTAHTHGRVSIEVEAVDTAGEVHPLGRLWGEFPSNAYARLTLPLRAKLPYVDLTALAGLRLKPRHHDSMYVSVNELRLARVHLQPYASEGMAPAPIVYAPTNRDVKRYAAGATTPVAPLMDPRTGQLLLSLADATVELSFPEGFQPAPEAAYGCRPVYGVASPAMRTDQGGCEDLATGLIWSFLSPGTMTWGDAVWDSRLAGNAPPDAHDAGRLDDYAGGRVPAGPDTSLVNHCHALTQGGYSDWRLPLETELTGITGAARAGTYFAFPTNAVAWSSTTWDATYAVTRDLTGGNRGYGNKATGLSRTLCVRKRTP